MSIQKIFFHHNISSFLYTSQIINENIGKKTTDITIPIAFIDHFDIVELIMLCIVSFGVGRLYEIFLNRNNND